MPLKQRAKRAATTTGTQSEFQPAREPMGFWVSDDDLLAQNTLTALENLVWISGHLLRPEPRLVSTVFEAEQPEAVRAAIANPVLPTAEVIDSFLDQALDGLVSQEVLQAGLEGVLQRWQWSTAANPESVTIKEFFADAEGFDKVEAELRRSVGVNPAMAEYLARLIASGFLDSLEADLRNSIKLIVAAYAEREELSDETIDALIASGA
ncbi:hypothetical protein [Curtobacterium flaccumfaciens]|uniref:hypothetical protein n=1 Tax=Curtobacterium flaccumfaciens TaxID=2035 RepID=UPI003879BC2D